MTGSEFLRKIEKLARRKKVHVSFIPERGKGSHWTLWYGGRRTTVPDRKKALHDLDQE